MFWKPFFRLTLKSFLFFNLFCFGPTTTQGCSRDVFKLVLKQSTLGKNVLLAINATNILKTVWKAYACFPQL